MASWMYSAAQESLQTKFKKFVTRENFLIIKNDENKKANLCSPTLALSASNAAETHFP